MNPVGDIGRLCRARGVTLVVDAVSALGAEDVDVVRDCIDICYSSANKCLHSVSGVSFLCVAPDVWPRLAKIPPRVYYLNLARHRQYLSELRQTPFTPAVSSFFALETALDELEEQGGVPARRDTYRKRNLRIRRLFADLGFESFSNTGRESHTISMFRLPDGLSVDALYDGMKSRGFIIYRAKGDLADRYMQISNMGELSDGTIDAFLAAVTDVVERAAKGDRGGPPGAAVGLVPMRAALFRRHGGPEVMEVGDVPTPTPGPGEVQVRVTAAGVNHVDLWLRRGMPALAVSFPHVPGGDVCGVVSALGAGVAPRPGTDEGERVLVNPGLSCGRCRACLDGRDHFCPAFKLLGEHVWGGQAEYVVVPAANLVPVPRDRVPLDDTALASLPIAFITAWQMLIDRAHLRPDETVLVVAAGSGVGVAAIQIAKLHGARVIAAASTDAKLAAARALGADETINSASGDLVAEVKRLTDRRGADVIIDHVGAATFGKAVLACARGGAHRDLRRDQRVRADPEPQAPVLAAAQRARLDLGVEGQALRRGRAGRGGTAEARRRPDPAPRRRHGCAPTTGVAGRFRETRLDPVTPTCTT